ncbi:hypothetical protein V8F06_009828, partial [Rhypophila decipiens]
LVKRDDEFDCKGNMMCATAPNLLRNCDSCVNFDIIRNDDLNYGGRDGRPDGARRGNCRVFIQGGAHCLHSGKQIWDDYQQIHGGHCEKCGSKHWGDGCMTSINYNYQLRYIELCGFSTVHICCLR